MATKKAKKRKCHGKNAAGKPCGSPPLKAGTEIKGVVVKGKHCRTHDPDLPDTARIQGAQPGSGRPRKPTADEILRERLEADIDRWLAPLEAALGAAKPVQMWNGQERKHEMVYVVDPKLGMQALKIALERVYGRPRQQVELSGGDGGPISFEHDLADPDVKEALFSAARAIDARRGS